MNKQQAEAWVKEITEILTGKNLISVAVTPISYQVEVRQNQKFDKCYIIEYEDNTCSIGLCDTYGVMTGSENWSIDPDRRTIHAKAINGFNEQLHFAWAIAENDDSGKLWHQMRDAQERLWKVR